MDSVLESIEQIQKTLEREVEWPLTDCCDRDTVVKIRRHCEAVNTHLNFLKLLVEVEHTQYSVQYSSVYSDIVVYTVQYSVYRELNSPDVLHCYGKNDSVDMVGYMMW